MQSFEYLDVQPMDNEHHVRIELRRPKKRNAFHPPMLEALRTVLADLERREEVFGGIIRGEGRAFCGGMDLGVLADLSPSEGYRLGHTLKDVFRTIRSSRIVYVASVHGGCLGAGFELALACDGIVAAEGTAMGLPEVQVGVPSMIDSALLQEIVGLNRAREILLTGDGYAAETLHDWGLVNRLAVPDRRGTIARSLLAAMTKNPSRILGMQKELIRSWMNGPLEQGIDHSVDVFSRSLVDNERLREAAREFLDA